MKVTSCYDLTKPVLKIGGYEHTYRTHAEYIRMLVLSPAEKLKFASDNCVSKSSEGNGFILEFDDTSRLWLKYVPVKRSAS